MENKYKIIKRFVCCGKNMVVVAMDGATCVMDEHNFNGMLNLEKSHKKTHRVVR